MYKRRLHTIVLAATLLVVAGTSARADYSEGGGFNSAGYGARAWGMGGAAIATAADEGAVYWNPALLSIVGENRAGFTYTDLIAGVAASRSHIAAVFALRTGPEDEPGLKFAYHTVGVMFSNLSLDLTGGAGYNENTLSLAYALAPQYFVSIGATFNFMLSSSDVEGFGSNGSSFDLGMRLRLAKRTTVALVARNVLSQVDFEDNASLTLPRAYTLGLAYRLWIFTGEADAEASNGGLSRYSLGAEARMFKNSISLRTGVQVKSAGENRMIQYYGFGVRAGLLSLDYNAEFDAAEAFGEIQRISMAIIF